MTDITLNHYLVLSGIIFGIGLMGIFWGRKTVITVLMSIELMLLAVNLNMISFSCFLKDMVGQVFTMFILTVAAAEAAIGLAILVAFHRNKNSITLNDMAEMKG